MFIFVPIFGTVYQSSYLSTLVGVHQVLNSVSPSTPRSSEAFNFALQNLHSRKNGVPVKIVWSILNMLLEYHVPQVTDCSMHFDHTFCSAFNFVC